MAIRLKVKEAIEARHMSVALLSRLANVDYKTVLSIVKDPYTSINTITLDKLAKALKMKPEDLLEGVEDRE